MKQNLGLLIGFTRKWLETYYKILKRIYAPTLYSVRMKVSTDKWWTKPVTISFSYN